MRKSAVGFQIETAILLSIGRLDRLPPDRSPRAERCLRIASHSRFAQVPTGLAGSRTIQATCLLEAGPTAIATAQSEHSERIHVEYGRAAMRGHG